MDKGIEDKIKQTLSDNYIVEDLNPARFNNLVQALTKLVEESRKEAVEGFVSLLESSGESNITACAELLKLMVKPYLSTLSPEQEGSKK